MEDRIKRSNITVVLNRPKYAGNIGSTARCIKNMGIERLAVVNDREHDINVIQQMATHFAQDVIDNMTSFDSLHDAVSGYQYVVGTTARLGKKNYRQPVIEPREMAERLVAVSQNNSVALVFGPEDRGLTNEELRLCQGLITIPTAESFKSLNLSHSVMIVCYELFVASVITGAEIIPRLATSAELEAMYDHLQKMFVTIDFINHENPDYWMMNVRRLFSRLQLTSKEVKIMRGICRHVERHVRQQKT